MWACTQQGNLSPQHLHPTTATTQRASPASSHITAFSLWLHLTLPKKGDELQCLSLAAVELSWGGWRGQGSGSGCRTARVGAHRHSPGLPPPPQSRTAPCGHDSPVPEQTPSPSPCQPTPDGTRTRSTLLRTAPAQVTTPERSSCWAPSRERRQHNGAAFDCSQCPDPFNPTALTQPLQLPIHPDRSIPTHHRLCALAHPLFFSGTFCFSFFPVLRTEPPRAGSCPPCSVGHRESLVLTLAAPGRCGMCGRCGRCGAARLCARISASTDAVLPAAACQ